MTGLQEAFYIVALVYMGLSLLLVIALVVAIVAIRRKVVSLENMVKEKLDLVSSIPRIVETVIGGVKEFTRHGK